MRSTLHIKEVIKKIRRTTPFVNVKKIVKIEPNVMSFLPEKFHQFLAGMTLRNKKLMIKVSNNAALMELQNFYKDSMLTYLQNVLPAGYEVNSVVFKNI